MGRRQRSLVFGCSGVSPVLEVYPNDWGFSFQQEGFDLQAFWIPAGVIRILYNLNDINDRSAYIEVGKTINYWSENKLFIFDDTLLHESVNDTNQTRYCLFVDIVRPTPL